MYLDGGVREEWPGGLCLWRVLCLEVGVMAECERLVSSVTTEDGVLLLSVTTSQAIAPHLNLSPSE